MYNTHTHIVEYKFLTSDINNPKFIQKNFKQNVRRLKQSSFLISLSHQFKLRMICG